jgi:hypothetical protein
MVLALRGVHSLLTLFFVSCLVYVYYAGIARKRTRLLAGASAALLVEGAVVKLNGGDCPLGTIHRRYGDDKAFFELLLPPRIARWAVPFLGGIAGFGFLLVLMRPPRRTGPA